MNCHGEIGPCPDLVGRSYRWLVRSRPSKRYEDARVIAMCPSGFDIFQQVSKNDLALSKHKTPGKRGVDLRPTSRYHRAILENEKGLFVVVTPKLYAELEQRRWRTA